ncbi:hypothetical protein SKAU_G00049490 [Synaphobranchus kaupii]|uniref:Uncharacterized protein n=1 Tax=Synaphobranchus kaupii TaxID=118154 RepID=A0A9Q1J7F8_SYNKA|nr:hypothetical protein SKAU_G00049490 [Synaphobranchus kaupii]
MTGREHTDTTMDLPCSYGAEHTDTALTDRRYTSAHKQGQTQRGQRCGTTCSCHELPSLWLVVTFSPDSPSSPPSTHQASTYKSKENITAAHSDPFIYKQPEDTADGGSVKLALRFDEEYCKALIPNRSSVSQATKSDSGLTGRLRATCPAVALTCRAVELVPHAKHCPSS